MSIKHSDVLAMHIYSILFKSSCQIYLKKKKSQFYRTSLFFNFPLHELGVLVMHVIIMWFLNHVVFHMYSVACLSNYLLYRANVYIVYIDLRIWWFVWGVFVQISVS